MKIKSIHLLAILAVTVSLIAFPSCKKEIGGCTDPLSATYNKDATMDDGSCKYKGCTDPASATYDPKASIDDGSCQYRGCTDPASETYDAKATIDDGSCQYKGCTDANSLTYDPKATIDDGSCTYARDAFIGSWAATETCNTNITISWTMTISAVASDVTKVSINNLGDYGFTIEGTVDGDKLTIDATDAGSGITVKGTGTLSGNKLDFSYTASNGFATDNCVGSATKN